MDCFYTAYSAHIRHLGLTPSRESRRIFYAMRSAILPEHRWISVQKEKEEEKKHPIVTHGNNHVQQKSKKKKRRHRGYGRGRRTEVGWLMFRPEKSEEDEEPTDEALQKIADEEDDDPLSDENGFINGVPWWAALEEEALQAVMIEDAFGNGGDSIFIPTAEQVQASTDEEKAEEWVRHGAGWVRNQNPVTNSWSWGGAWEQGWGYSSYSSQQGMRTGLTPTSVAPWIARTLALLDGVTVNIEYVSWWNATTYLQEAETEEEKRVINETDYGKEVDFPDDLTLAPAIYCMVSSKHAQFGTSIPKHGVCCMAIQLSVNKLAHRK